MRDVNGYYGLMDNGEHTADRTYIFDMPPSANRYWRNFRGHMVISSEAKEYKRHVAQTITIDDHHDPLNRGGGMLLGRVGIRLLFMLADNRNFDLDNRIKVLLDSMQGAVYADDKQVFAIYAEKTIQAKVKGGVKPVERVIVYVFDGARIGDVQPIKIRKVRA